MDSFDYAGYSRSFGELSWLDDARVPLQERVVRLFASVGDTMHRAACVAAIGGEPHAFIWMPEEFKRDFYDRYDLKQLTLRFPLPYVMISFTMIVFPIRMRVSGWGEDDPTGASTLHPTFRRFLEAAQGSKHCTVHFKHDYRYVGRERPVALPARIGWINRWQIRRFLDAYRANGERVLPPS